MNLGPFSHSLNVKDLATSRAFYEALGFKPVGGDAEQGWLILANTSVTIGLFQGMFDQNIMTFNPRWNTAFVEDPGGTDIRTIQADLKAKGIKPVIEADESKTGPAHLILEDPDGNRIMLDQHV